MKKKVYFYPDYTRSNTYQEDIAKDLVSDFHFVGLKSYALLKRIVLSGLMKKEDILHLHWVHDIYSGVPEHLIESRRAEFLSVLDILSAKGARIIWTVHNVYPHNIKLFDNLCAEGLFRQKVADAVTSIHLLHPCQVELIPWFNHHHKVLFIEHPVKEIYYQKAVLDKFKNELFGESNAKYIVSFIGQYRDYKVPLWFPFFLENILASYPDILIVFSGKVLNSELRRVLSSSNFPNLRWYDGYQPEDRLSLLVSASDLGFLTYKNVLNSGSLFYYMSRGVPVVAPDIGTIPSYVVHGWNGFLYNNYCNTSIYGVLDSLSPELLSYLKYNTSLTSKSIRFCSKRLYD